MSQSEGNHVALEASPGGALGACISIMRTRHLPFVSVIIRAYRRPESLLELLAKLGTQNYSCFEVVVLEQTEDSSILQRIQSLNDSRIRVIPTTPMNAPAARNAAVRSARGDIFLCIDDDDLPLRPDWVSQHVKNYEDPFCMGVVGRLVPHPDRLQGPCFPRLVRVFAMRHTLFKDTRCYANNTLRKRGIDFLIGSNASVRRSIVERIGGWDEGIPMNEEQSFAIRFARMRRMDEYFAFDPGPVMWRRTDIPGGLERRSGNEWYLRELEARLFYYRHVVGHYYPCRYRILYLLFFPRAVLQVLEWIWDPDNRQHSLTHRLLASVDLFVRAHSTLRGRRYSSKDIRRVPQLF